MPKRKQVTMQVTVTGPSWMTAEIARRNVRDLIGNQCFSGTVGGDRDTVWEEIDEYNFKVKAVKACPK